MKALISITVALLAFSLSAMANEDIFYKAQSAYDDGRYAEAVVLYNKLLDQDINNTEVHYNLANACFKDSDLPTAVWHYRKAWYNAPRDPDIRANLHFALNAAGAIDPAPVFIERFLTTLSLGEWLILALVGYIALALVLIASLLMKTGIRQALKLCLLPIVLIFLSVAGWRYWRQLQLNPEWVVVKSEATALFGPVEGSTAHYKLPLAALVRQLDIDPKGWIEVEYDGKRGWLHSDYISRLSP
jgi:tetratricopeptide (TPR) repeat protein